MNIGQCYDWIRTRKGVSILSNFVIITHAIRSSPPRKKVNNDLQVVASDITAISSEDAYSMTTST